MGTKTLKEKIFEIAFWMVFFFCAFLIVGYLIDSGFLKVVPAKDKIYEILKDALSISAAFLAPVAAFVLFSDWRQEHLEKKLEADSESIFKKISDIYLKLFEVRMSICKEITLEENEGLRINMVMELLTIELMRIRNYINLLKEKNTEANIFIEQSNKIVKSLNEVNNNFYDIQNAFVSSRKMNKKYDYLSAICLTTEKLTANSEKIDNLNEICKTLQVKS